MGCELHQGFCTDASGEIRESFGGVPRKLWKVRVLPINYEVPCGSHESFREVLGGVLEVPRELPG